MHGETMPGIDSAWLRMDDPTHRMIITVVLTLDQPVSTDEVRALVRDHLRPHRRFRRRVLDRGGPLARPRWADDPEPGLAYHVRDVELPAPADDEALADLVGALMGTPLDPDRPLWQVHHVLNHGPGGSLIVRIHHCIADGIALVRLMLSLCTTEPGTAPARHVPPAVRRSGTAALLARAAAAVAGVRSAADARDLLRPGVAAAATGVRLLAMRPDPPTPLRGPLGTDKRAAWTGRVSLDAVKAAGKRLDGTINDVLLTAVAGGLGRYLERRGGTPVDPVLRAVVPVNLRAAEAQLELGNCFGLVFVELPVGPMPPRDRLADLKGRMDRIKASSEALATCTLLRVVGFLPRRAQRAMIDLFGRRATAVLTNVPGPRQPLYVAGRRIRDVMFWVPQSGHLGLGISLLSYSGQVRVGIATDSALVPDPWNLAGHVEAAMRELIEDAPRAAAEPREAAVRGPIPAVASLPRAVAAEAPGQAAAYPP